jgi:serine O-acetyltransferase
VTPYQFIQSDLLRFNTETTLINILKALVVNRAFKYVFWLRFANHKNKMISVFSRLMHRYYSNSYQIQIPREATIGPGLYLGHATTIVMSPSTIIGKNCNLSHFVNIGANHGKAATIGDNVYIGPNCSLVEAVQIGDNVTIGAGSVVVKNIPANATAVGSPARVVNYNAPAQYINNKAI